MEWMLVWRWLKWLGLIFWGIGIDAVLVNTERQRKVHGLYLSAVSGFALTWMSGWMMMKGMGYSMGVSWISNAMLLGLLSLTGTFLSAFTNTKRVLWNTVSLTGFLGSIAMMVVRDGSVSTQISLLALATLVGAGLAAWLTQPSELDAPDSATDAMKSGFQWVARLEGLTVLVLFLLYIPAKKILDVNLDNGTGMIGWTHGVFVMVYVLSLTFTARALGWSIKQWVLGGLSSFLPFGTFLFERHIFKEETAPSDLETQID